MLISGLLATIGLLLAGFQIDIKAVNDTVFGAVEVVNQATCKSASATSSLTYMTPGTATTSVTCAFPNQAPLTAVLAIEVNASSTLSEFGVIVEQSMDNIDFYPINILQAGGSTTTAPVNLGLRGSWQFTFASSTVGGASAGSAANGVGVNGTQNRNHYQVDIPVSMKYVRALLYPTIGSTNGGGWLQIIPKVEL